MKAVSYLALYIGAKEAFKWVFANILPVISIMQDIASIFSASVEVYKTAKINSIVHGRT
jgi:hypothetical protein